MPQITIPPSAADHKAICSNGSRLLTSRAAAGLAVALCLLTTAAAQALPRDVDGWSILKPSADSRLVYVSSSAGDDANDGLSEAAPKKTLAAGDALLRDGGPDWLLLKRGDTWEDDYTFRNGSGRSDGERRVYTYYGTTGDRPLLKRAQWSFTSPDHQPRGHIAVVGIHVYYETRDPLSPRFVSLQDTRHGVFYFGPDSGANVLIEDCIFRNGDNSVVIQAVGRDGGRVTNVAVRRTAIWDTVNGTTPYDGRSLGPIAPGPTQPDWVDRSTTIYVYGCSGVLLEECFMDHGGWAEDAAGNVVGNGKSVYCQNMYLQDGNRDVTVVGNISSRAGTTGCQARAGNMIRDNLFVLNPLALFSDADELDGESSRNDVIDNVIIAGNDILPSVWKDAPVHSGGRGTGMQLFRRSQGHYQGNILLDAESVNTGGNHAMIGSVGKFTGNQPVKVYNTIIRNWKDTEGVSVTGLDNPEHFDLRDLVVDGIDQKTGQPVEFVDGQRTLGTYLASIGASGGNLEFIRAARAAWLGAPRTFPSQFRAATVNQYFREGFTRAASTTSPAK